MSIFFSSCLLAGMFIATASRAQTPDDPHQWLEQLNGPEAMQWVNAENAKTLSVLEKDPRYDRFLRDALAILEADDRIPYPSFVHGRIFNFWQDPDHVRGIWRHATTGSFAAAKPEWKTVLDLDALARVEGANWVWKGAVCEMPAGRRCLVMLSDGGEDAVSLREFDLADGQFVAHGFQLPRGKQDVQWQDRDTLVVGREWSPGELTESGYPYVVKRVRRGLPIESATEIFRGKKTDVGVTPAVLHDGSGHSATIIHRSLSFFETEFYLDTPKGPARLALPLKSEVAAMVDGQLIVKLEQDWTAGQASFKQGSLVAIDLAQATKQPAFLAPTLVYAPGPREALESVSSTRNTLVVEALDNVRGRAYVFERRSDGGWDRSILPLPDNSAISMVDTDLLSDAVYLDVAGFLTPSSLWLGNARSKKLERIISLPSKFDASRDVVEQLEASSSDGTRIPYFIVRPASIRLDGSNPTIVNAYGGFQVSSTPYYSAVMGRLWLEQGGVFVLANIRGGGEFGPAWHDAGLKTRRQIVYDDFAAVARDLIARGITSARHLGIQGGSNGGLLMGVEMTQHPELFNAVDIAVPLLDMLRYEKIQAGASWVGEYGSVAVPEERAFLASISPYANLKRGVPYPEPLVWTTTKDDRVGPQHARKFAARMAELGLPYLFYEVVEGGHGAGANLKETAKTKAMEFTYFARKLMASSK